MLPQNTLLLVLSDFQTGSSTALFPNHIAGDENQNHSPFPRQLEIYAVYEKVMQYVAVKRQGKRLIIVNNGDAIEGLHHGTEQVCIMNKGTQVKIHIELMRTLMAAVGFDKLAGDRLYYVRGTEAHTQNYEKVIGEALGAEQSRDNIYVFDELALLINGRIVEFVHHGPHRGKGANEGNALYHWLRDNYWDGQKLLNKVPPDVVITGHRHTPTYQSYSARRGDGFHTIHGIICPSWQAKTRYAYRKAPLEVNEIGAVVLEITAAGDIVTPRFILREVDPVVPIAV